MESFGPPSKKWKVEGHSEETICKYIYTAEGCRFGDSCRFNHSAYPPSSNHNAAKESSGVGSKSQACLKFFSTSGCPYGEGCHFAHFVPGGFTPSSFNLTSNHASVRKPPLSSSSLMMMPSFDHQSPQDAYKVKLCNRYSSAEGCRFGDKCHFAHGEHELRKPKATNGGSMFALDRDTVDRFGGASPLGWGGGFDGRFSSVKREPTPPGLAAVTTFGASSTAKISVDASLAGVIIGKGGSNTKNICRSTGAKLTIRDHESDSKLKNIEMEGSFEQIKLASAMIRELLMHADVSPAPSRAPPGGLGSHNYKTKMCEKFAQQACTFGDRCHFAHNLSELRQPVSDKY